MVGDKGCSSEGNRTYLRRRRIAYTIPRRANEQRGSPLDDAMYRMQDRVERLVNRLKQYRRIATRHEKLAENYLTMIHIGSILLWL
jgi:transposase